MITTIWLGSRASIWQHRGYPVLGERVVCDDLDDAHSVLAAEYGEDLIDAESCDGGTNYYYASQADADADQTGARALAAITEDTNP